MQLTSCVYLTLSLFPFLQTGDDSVYLAELWRTKKENACKERTKVPDTPGPSAYWLLLLSWWLSDPKEKETLF